MRRRLFATVLVLSAFAIPASAAITGSVMTPEGAPVAGARVSIYGSELPDARRTRLLSQSPARVAVETVQTDAKGAFSVPSPKDAIVQLRVDAAGYEPQARAVERDEDTGAIVLSKRETRKGTITSGGKPVANATVLISYGSTELVARTDEQGRYDAPDVKRASGITVLHPDYAVDFEMFQQAGTPSSEMDRTLTAGTKLTGRVVAADGTTPVANATILVDQWPLATSGEDGTFTVAHAPSRWMTITARKDSLITQRTSDSVKGAVTLKMEKAAVVSGRVTDSKSKLPVAGANVNLSVARRFWMEGSSLAAFTDAKGAYSIVAPAGTYSVNATHPAFEFGNAEVTVLAGQQAAKDLAISQLARVSGVVVDEMQKPVVAAVVTTEQVSEGGNPMRMMSQRMFRTPARTVSGPDGRFSVRIPSEQDLRLNAAKKGMPLAKGDALHLAPAERKTGVVLTIPTGVAVSGVVKDKDGNALSGVSVVASETPQGRGGMMFRQIVMGGGFAGEEEDNVTTARDGTFTLRVKEGTYDFSFRRDGYAPKAVRAQSVTLQGTPAIETTMEPAVEISGRVTRGGVGVPDVIISTFGPSDNSTTITGPDGAFTVGGLSAGSTRLMLRKEADFIQDQRTATAPARDLVFEIPPGGRVTGRVVEKGSSKPITSFQAGITTSRGGGGFVMMGPPQMKSFTSDDGSFTLENVPTGSMNVVAQAPGYANGRASVEIEEGKTASDIMIELDTGVRLVGKVTGPSGQALSDATVQLQPSPTGQFSRGSMRRAVTDANGEFTLESLDPGEEMFEISHPKYLATTKEVTLKGREMRMDVQLSGGQRVTGVVVTDSGMPVGEAEVEAFTASGAGGERTRTNSSGQFEFASLSASRYRFTANKSGYLEGVMDDVDVSSGGNVRIQLRTGGTIYGRVIGLTEQELSGATVTARSGRTASSGAVDPQGNFRIEGTPIGTVQISAASASRGLMDRRTSGTKTVDVSAGNAVQVDLEFRADTVVRGRITRNGTPLGGASVMFQPRGGSRASASMTADEAGNYNVAGLEEGEYSVMVADIQRFNPYQTTYQVRSGASTFDIDYRVSSVRGRVIDASTNEPLADATVSFRPSGAGEMRFVRSAATDPNGNFTMDSVSPGSYTVTAAREDYGTDVKEETFGDSGRDGLEFRISRAEGITLKVVDGRNGQPISAIVMAWDAAGRVVHEPTGMRISTGANDQHISVPPGTYTATVWMANYAPQSVQLSAPSIRTVALTPGGTILVQSKHSTTRHMRLIDANGMWYPRMSSIPPTRELLPGTLPLEHIAPGSYTLQLLNEDQTVADTVPVVVREQETTRVTL